MHFDREAEQTNEGMPRRRGKTSSGGKTRIFRRCVLYTLYRTMVSYIRHVYNVYDIWIICMSFVLYLGDLSYISAYMYYISDICVISDETLVI